MNPMSFSFFNYQKNIETSRITLRSRLRSQKRLIHETDWDTLIVLDACRYGYFKEVYGYTIQKFVPWLEVDNHGNRD